MEQGQLLCAANAFKMQLVNVPLGQRSDGEADGFAISGHLGGSDLRQDLVDLVASGRTLRENGLVEVEHIADVTTRFAVNRSAFKTRSEQIRHWLERFRAAAGIDARAA